MRLSGKYALTKNEKVDVMIGKVRGVEEQESCRRERRTVYSMYCRFAVAATE